MSNENKNDYVPMLGSKTLLGTEVMNKNGEKLGKVEDIMIDLGTGRIGYVVLSFGGVLGMGDKLFAVPWASLLVDQDNKKLVMEANKELLKNAPGFDKNNWPQHPNGMWVKDVYRFYNQEPYWENTP